MSSNNGGRGWFEGTLDVISGMAPRPSTPVGGGAPSKRLPAAPDSPARGGGLHRMPSQDSLDRSIHNDSGHGKSTTQVIRDLRQSNARLTARTAELEADFMNQMNEATIKYERNKQLLESSLKQKEKHVATLDTRCRSMETRMREKEEHLTRLKEESAFQRHTISDIKTRLHQLESEKEMNGNQRSDPMDVWNDEKEEVYRELDELRIRVEKEAEEKDRFKQELARLQQRDGRSESTTDDDELRRTQDALHDTESALAQLKSEQKRASAQHDQRVGDLKEEFAGTSANWKIREETLLNKIQHLENQNKSESNLDSQLSDRDEMIEELRQQVLDYSGQLTALTSELTKVRSNAESQEQYRRDEADDLRVLNDAQEEEIDSLRKQLEGALSEIEMRDQELEEQKSRSINTSKDSVETDHDWQLRLNESREHVDGLQRELEEIKASSEEQVSALRDRVAELLEENKSLAATGSSRDFDDEKEHRLEETKNMVEELSSKCAQMEKELADSKKLLTVARKDKERLNFDHRRKVTSLDREKNAIQTKLKEQLAKLESEMAVLRETSQAGESTDSTHRGIASIQSGGAVEEDLRKQLENAKSSEASVRTDLELLRETKELEIVELKEKLSDRDVTISALVKSSVGLEQRVASSSQEIDIMRAKLSQQVGDEGVDVIVADSRLSNENMDELRRSLDAYKETETKLTQEITRLKRQLLHSKHDAARFRNQVEALKTENTRLREAADAAAMLASGEHDDDNSIAASHTSTNISTNARKLLEERDDAISSLVQQSMAQEQLINELKNRLTDAAKELDRLRQKDASGPTIEEVQHLRREAEVFAGQVIELDDEISALKSKLSEKESMVESLNKEVSELKDRPTSSGVDEAKIMDLEAEMDEIKESKSVLTNEVRLLRRKLWDFDAMSDDLVKAKNETTDAKKELEEYKRMLEDMEAERVNAGREDELESSLQEAKSSIAELEKELQNRDDTISQLQSVTKSASTDIDEMELQEEIETLKIEVSTQKEAVQANVATIRELEALLAEKNEADASAFEEEKEELMADIDNLTQQLQEAQTELRNVEAEREIIDDFKEKLERADEARSEETEKIVDTYERKIKLLTLDKDVTIDKLRNELTSEKEANQEEREELSQQVQHFQEEIVAQREIMVGEIQGRDQRIFALEHTLDAQEQLVNNMRVEMDQLQGSMESSAANRRGEVEEMEKELLKLSATNKEQDREISALRSQLNEQALAHSTVVAKLEETIMSYENQGPSDHRTASDLQMELRMREVKERLEKLMWRNSSLKEENETLRERLNRAQSDVSTGESDKDRVFSLERQLTAQSQKIQELQDALQASEDSDSPWSKKSAEPPASPVPNRQSSATMRPPVPLQAVDKQSTDSKSKANEKKTTAASPARRGLFGLRRGNSQDAS